MCVLRDEVAQHLFFYRKRHGNMKTKIAKFLATYPLLVLLASLLITVGIWCAWLTQGIEFTHDRVALLSNASTRSASTLASASQSAASLNRQTYFTEVGQTGDAFGGVNALLTAIAGALVGWTGFMQYLSLHESRSEAKEERKIRQRQEFESLFFRMLDLSRDLTHRIESHGKKYLSSSGFASEEEPRTGAAALDSFAAKVKSAWKVGDTSEVNIRALVKAYQKNVYNANPSALGPYFRLLFQTFKHVAESQLEPHEKIQYANIARGQMSEGAVLLLALNGLTPFGHSFIRYIEEFGLLEHMHVQYLETYKAGLQIGYRERAFLGSQKRKQYPLEMKPMHGAKYFVADGADGADEEDAES
jgi:hypothetical protein